MTNYANPWSNRNAGENHSQHEPQPAPQPTPKPDLTVVAESKQSIEGTADPFFSVVERELAINDGLAFDQPLGHERHKVIVRGAEEGKPVLLGVVGSDYHLVPNRDLFSAFENGLRNAVGADALADARIRDHLSRNGAFSKREYIIPSIKCEIDQDANPAVGWNHRNRDAEQGGTTILYRATITNSYDGSAPAKMGGGGLDIACLNGMLSVTNQHILQRKHTSRLQLPDFTSAVEASVERFNDQARVIQDWANRQISGERAQELLAALPKMSERKAKKLAERFALEAQERGASLWALYSAMTYYSSHASEQFGVRKTGQDNVAEALDNREQEVLFWINSTAWKEAVRV